MAIKRKDKQFTPLFATILAVKRPNLKQSCSTNHFAVFSKSVSQHVKYHSKYPSSKKLYPHGQDPEYYMFLNPSHSITSLNEIVTPPIQHCDAATVQYLPVPLVQLRDPCGKKILTLLCSFCGKPLQESDWSSGHSSLNILIWSREL